MVLHEFIVYNSIHAGPNIDPVQSALLQEQSEKLQNETSQLQQELIGYKEKLSTKEEELIELRSLLKRKEAESVEARTTFVQDAAEDIPERKGVSRSAFLALLLLTIGLAAFSAYSLFKNTGQTQQQTIAVDSTVTPTDTTPQSTFFPEPEKKPAQRRKDSLLQAKHITDSIRRANKRKRMVADSLRNAGSNDSQNGGNNDASTDGDDNRAPASAGLGRYKAISKAYFYSDADEDTRRDGIFINKWNPPATALEDFNGFIRVVYVNEKGQTTRGWLLKSELRRVQ
jgi:hypothetical protein